MDPLFVSVPPVPESGGSTVAATAPTPRKALDLPISRFRGPEVNLPWRERTEVLRVEEQLEDAVGRLQKAQEERLKLEEDVGSGKYPRLG